MKSSLKALKKFWQLSPPPSSSSSPSVDNYQQALQLVPDLANTHYQLATHLKDQGKLTEAIVHYRQAIELHAASGSQVLPEALMETHSEDNGDEEQQNSPIISAQITSTPSLPPSSETTVSSDLTTQSSPNHQPSLPPAPSQSNQAVQVYLQQAQGYYGQKKWEQVIQACQSALAINPHICEAYKWWGNALQAQGQDFEAMGYYGKALEIEPNSAPVHVNLGNLYAKQQEWSKAIEYYRRAVELDSNLALAHRNLARILGKVGETEEATKSRYQALSIEPEKGTASEHIELGQQLWTLGWLEEATNCYRRGVRLQPDGVRGYELLGDALIRQGEVKEGKTYIQRAQELRHQGGKIADNGASLALRQPESSLVTTSVSMPISATNQAHQVLQQAESVLKTAQQLLKPSQNALNQANQAIVQAYQVIEQVNKEIAPHLVATGNGKAAQIPAITKQLNGKEAKINQTFLPSQESVIEHYVKKAMLEPDSAKIQADLGSLYAKRQDWSKAIACYQKALAVDPSLAPVYRNLAKALTQAGQSQKALVYWYQALRLEPKEVDAQQHLDVGNQLLAQGKLEQAVVCYQQAISLQPDFREAYHRLGEVLVKQEKLDKAISIYHHGLSQNDTDVVCWYQLGEIYKTQQEWDKVIECYQKLVKLQPNSPQVYNNFGKILLQLNQLEEAQQAFNQAIELNN